MSEYKAYFREHRKEHLLNLELCEVVRIVGGTHGTQAIARNHHGKEFKFWLCKPDNELGARRRVSARHGFDYPTIIIKKDDFSVDIGTKVLLVRPKGSGSANPVVSLESYNQARETQKQRAASESGQIEVIGGLKGHRFVD